MSLAGPLDTALVATASEPYRASGRFARGKLMRDPVFGAILAGGLLEQRLLILDLGCGQGLLAAWLLAAGSRARIRGIELEHRYVMRAQRAWGQYAAFETGDLRRTDFGSVDGVVILDVLPVVSTAKRFPMSQGTPFANVLMIATPRSMAAP